MYKGSCLCGTVRYEFLEIIGDYVYCHCRSCRKASGSAFGANISVPIDSFSVVAGEDRIRVFESSPGKHRHFCSHCGSPLYTKVGPDPSVVRVRLGSLDSNYDKSPSAHIFTGDKPAWSFPETRTGDLPSYETWPPPGSVNLQGSTRPVD